VNGWDALEDGMAVKGRRSLKIQMLGRFHQKISEFFTFRKPQASYFVGPEGPDEWSWLEVYPQHPYVNSSGVVEQVSVGVAQNAVDGKLSVMSNPLAHGRSFHNGTQPPVSGQNFHGANFEEQWGRAMQIDPEIVFVTGWNEWIAGRFNHPGGFFGAGVVSFVDSFNTEFSRDCEPMKGGHGDAYYWQLVANVRKFKGVRDVEMITSMPIEIDGRFEDWKLVAPSFLDDIGDPVHRDHRGWDKNVRYVNYTGRNDIVEAKVSVTSEELHFYVKSAEALSPSSDPNWMLLFIDSDNNPETGWLGYDFMVRGYDRIRNKATLNKSIGKDYSWEAVGECDYREGNSEIELRIPKSAVGISIGGGEINFKWCDNILQTGDWSDFTINGDAAPNDRYNYRAIFSK